MSLPATFVDLSDVREVPDHQEVMADTSTNNSLIVEIVEATATDNAACATVYWDDLAQVTESSATQMQQVEPLGPSALPHLAEMPGFHASLAVGTMHVAKERQGEEARHTILALLAVVRLPQVGSDLLITLHVPLEASASGASASAAQGPELGSNAPASQPASAAEIAAAAVAAKPLMLAMLSTLRVHDWGLFGGG